jgi:DNA-binding transcriptional LysR family regulator
MNTLHLKALLLAIESGSISAAARKLGKKQSQVSQWISDLECDLGVTFFERTGNKTVLSEQGACLLPNLVHSLSQLERFIQSADTLAREEPTVIRVGIENYLPDSAFVASLAEVLAHSSLNIEVYRDDKAQLQADLQANALDVMLIHESDIAHHPQFEYARLGYYREVLVCGAEHPLAGLAQVSSQALSQYRELVWGREQTMEDEPSEGCDGFSPSYGLFSELAPLVALLSANQGFAFLPEDSVKAQVSAGTLVRLSCDFELPAIERRVELCWRNGFTLSERGKAVVTAFRAHHQLVTS